MKIVVAAPPGHGLLLPLVPLAWAARVAGHEVLVVTAGEVVAESARAGLPVHDVLPDRDVWAELIRAMATIRDPDGPPADGVSEELRAAVRSGNPFGLFTQTMTAPTRDVARAFGAELVVHSSDHPTGALAALALDLPVLEVGNRVTWSMRDAEFAAGRDPLTDDEVTGWVRERLGLPPGRPRTLARVDPRPPSMAGLTGEQADPRDGAPWWAMRYVPFNGGSVVPDWALARPERPRVLVTLGTVVPSLTGASNLAVVVEALGGLDVEVVLATGSADLSGLGTLPGNVRAPGWLALSSVLPRCALIVHHGGSGTTAAPLHYGVPQLVLPGFADNGMAAERVAGRGVGLTQDPATATVDGVRALVGRLLAEPGFAAAAAEVAGEMAAQPSPASVLDRAVARAATALVDR